ncbi:hypothetical protein [Roseinatronobacter monicus]|uniref:Uncharacterized protein n=1 Tax=Roseinatronobacter monicus TaxID=393481 RepID=A0A543KIL1_9RHOB|nr:hypothetical protein [Roseinatronobacter monicus]TQM94910.1 hypothetical protein BD293_3602 [Roseinatronobacter monicus]
MLTRLKIDHLLRGLALSTCLWAVPSAHADTPLRLDLDLSFEENVTLFFDALERGDPTDPDDLFYLASNLVSPVRAREMHDVEIPRAFRLRTIYADQIAQRFADYAAQPENRKRAIHYSYRAQFGRDGLWDRAAQGLSDQRSMCQIFMQAINPTYQHEDERSCLVTQRDLVIAELPELPEEPFSTLLRADIYARLFFLNGHVTRGRPYLLLDRGEAPPPDEWFEHVAPEQVRIAFQAWSAWHYDDSFWSWLRTQPTPPEALQDAMALSGQCIPLMQVMDKTQLSETADYICGLLNYEMDIDVATELLGQIPPEAFEDIPGAQLMHGALEMCSDVEPRPRRSFHPEETVSLARGRCTGGVLYTIESSRRCRPPLSLTPESGYYLSELFASCRVADLLSIADRNKVSRRTGPRPPLAEQHNPFAAPPQRTD